MFDEYVTRRRFLGGALVLSGAALFPVHQSWAEEADADAAMTAALASSPLIYLSPIRSDGSESRCQAEIWYATDAGALYVVTSASAWRSQAIAKGLDRARIWVGDFGPWKDANSRYKSAPSFIARAETVAGTDDAQVSRALSAFGKKYAKEWGKWGPRFRNGLADGSRVLIRYQPVEA